MSGPRPGHAARRRALLLLRASCGLLLAVWGADKLLDERHGIQVAAAFYGGVAVPPALMTLFGAAEVALGVAVALGLWRRVTYAALLAVTGTTLLAVWKSVVDPLGLVFADARLLFHPSLIIFAAALVLWTFRDGDDAAPGPRGAATRTGGEP